MHVATRMNAWNINVRMLNQADLLVVMNIVVVLILETGTVNGMVWIPVHKYVIAGTMDHQIPVTPVVGRVPVLRMDPVRQTRPVQLIAVLAAIPDREQILVVTLVLLVVEIQDRAVTIAVVVREIIAQVVDI